MTDEYAGDAAEADGDGDVGRCFSTRARVQAMLDVEACLAEAEAALDIIPASSALAIRAAAVADLYDVEAIAAESRRAGNLAIPLVHHLTRHVGEADEHASRYVHWGATSQDIIDSGLVLQLRASVPIVLHDLRRAANAAAGHARRHVFTAMPGRTWLQQATPITFGLKAAGWCDALMRVQRGLQEAFDAALVLQFGGASGTLAALGTRGLEVAATLGACLRLTVPALPWHTHRDRVAALACALGVATGTLGKIGRDLGLLAQTEVGEAHERPGDAGGSSTMAHKQNPVRAAIALAAAVRAPGLVATVLSAMPQEHERALGGWQAEWDTVPELVIVTGGAARAIAEALEGLVVDGARMRGNLELTHGLVMAEAITMRLAPHLGKSEAHARVEAAARRAIAEGAPLADVLAQDPAVTAVLDRAEIDATLRPENYLGAAVAFVTSVLEARDADEAAPE
ncbi:MAG: 3-carboxy-cis,cis-muconate cycloisomerase [Acidobacteriota bacterium]